MKKLLSLILTILSVSFAFAADADWKIHPIFDEEVTHVVETPSYVYFTSRQMQENPTHEVYLSLFRYDKKGDELMALSNSNFLSGNTVRDIIYNPSKGYLAVLYIDYNIDLLYNDGKVVNIPFYKQSSLTVSKGVNSFAVDPDHDRLYLATDFGYLAINDKKNEIAESHIYSTPLSAFCRVGENYLVIKDDNLLSIDVNSSKLSLSMYQTIGEFDKPSSLYPLADNLCLLFGGDRNARYVKILSFNEDGFDEENIDLGTIFNIENTPSGVTVTTNNKIYRFQPDGIFTSIERPEGFRDSAAASLNMTDVWNGLKRKGINSIRKTGETWSVTKDWMAPDAPATYITKSFANHPSKGFLMLNYGTEPTFMSLYDNAPLQLSGYSKGRWTNYAPLYTLPENRTLLLSTNGLAIDPDNKNLVYISSFHSGIARLNLEDPNDIIHLSFNSDPDNGKDGFLIFNGIPQALQGWSNISAPYFDKQGNLWMAFEDHDDNVNPHASYFCWLAQDRRNTTSVSNIQPPKKIKLDFYCPINNYSIVLPLLHTGNGLILHASFVSAKPYMALFNTNGTPTDTSDDSEYAFESFSDADGTAIEMGRIRCMYEDPNTGYVWIGHQNGVCYISPKNIMAGNFSLNKVKVSRNDGTNLADYLLEGVRVNQITQDADGRKWFATNGGGAICTTSDGREILEEFTSSNSPLPDDVVYGIGYNSENNSLMFSTSQGYAEYFLPAVQATSTKTDVKAYPNPVRPEYSGYVTISDIPTGSFVKITDVKGNLVKDLGIMSGFDILWDISDTNFNRVKSGVYHIMVSPSDESSSYSAVGKILVIS